MSRHEFSEEEIGQLVGPYLNELQGLGRLAVLVKEMQADLFEVVGQLPHSTGGDLLDLPASELIAFLRKFPPTHVNMLALMLAGTVHQGSSKARRGGRRSQRPSTGDVRYRVFMAYEEAGCPKGSRRESFLLEMQAKGFSFETVASYIRPASHADYRKRLELHGMLKE